MIADINIKYSRLYLEISMARLPMFTIEEKNYSFQQLGSKTTWFLLCIYSPTGFNEEQVLKICVPEAFSVLTGNIQVTSTCMLAISFSVCTSETRGSNKRGSKTQKYLRKHNPHSYVSVNLAIFPKATKGHHGASLLHASQKAMGLSISNKGQNAVICICRLTVQNCPSLFLYSDVFIESTQSTEFTQLAKKIARSILKYQNP